MKDPDLLSPQPAMDDAYLFYLQAGMEDPVTTSLGPGGSLLRKLHSLGCSLPDWLGADEFRLFRDELTVLYTSLKNMSEDEDARFMARWWMKMVRELFYDTEDLVDEICGVCTDEVFSELVARTNDATESLKFLQRSPKTIEPHPAETGVSSFWFNSSTLRVVEPPSKLVELLALDNGEETLKVIPVKGCAGVGKTTVARTLYHRHGWKFQCRAFVSVSRYPDMRGFLTSMLSQLKASRPHSFAGVPELVECIRKHLEGKRYLIVVDDLWTASVWDIISSAFPCGRHCSRIITTTQIDDVALACCSYDSDYTYKMEPLNDTESRILFFSRVFGSEDSCPTYMKDVAHEIVRKCGGLPLAIVNIASLLASEPNIVEERWMHIQNSLPHNSKGMTDVLNLICTSLPLLMYNSLPHRLRSCLLYVSMYPQGFVIKKDELVKHCVAEGFLGDIGGRDTEEIAGGYFDELVSRGMLQAVETNNNGAVLSCTVHQMVLDFIRSKSMEENFVINLDYFQSTLALPDKVRRLSVQFGGVKSAYIPESIVTSHVRSLIFWGFFRCVPSITDFGLLRVLVLHIWADRDKSFDLTTMGKLFQLKYLKIECNVTIKLPGKIRRLQHLGTMHVDARLSAVPSDIVYLERLLHLRLLSEFILPSVLVHMTSLRSLGYIDLSSHSEENVLHLGRLTNLQDLQLTCSTVQPPAESLKRKVQLLCSVLEKLTVLLSVTLVPASAASCAASINIPFDGFSMISPPPDLLLRRIELSPRCCIFFTLPEWFGELRKLCTLKIAIRQLWKEDVDILKGLPSLTALTLYIQTAPAEKIFVDHGGFQVLTYFKFICAAPCLSFVQGAMPKVQKLILGFNANNRRSHTFGTVGFHRLSGLIEFYVKLGARDDDKFDIQAAESALEVAVRFHPNTLIRRVQRVGVIFDGDEDQSTATELKDMARRKFLMEIQQGKKMSTEGSTDGPTLEMPNEIQEDKNKTTKPAEQHVNNQDNRRYTRRESVFTPLNHYPQSDNLLFGSVLKKLSIFLEENNLGTRVKFNVRELQRELVKIEAFLMELVERQSRQLHERRSMIYAEVLRDLSYDAEDGIDSFLVCIQGSRGGIMSLVPRVFSGRKARPRLEFAHAIDRIRILGLTLEGELGMAASIYRNIDNPPAITSKPHLSNPKELVGIKESRDEVIRKLTDGTNDELKIISIVGIGGLGKTTLAKSVYDRVQMQFNCRAFVSVSFEPDMTKVLMDILLQIDKQKYLSLCGATLDIVQLTGVIRRALANKRYLIVVDDMCDVVSWEKISCVLLDDILGSRVVITTWNYNVAERAGDIYMLKTLSLDDSTALFKTKLFCGKEFPSGLPEVYPRILRLCGGVPLAIIAVASFLAEKLPNDWLGVFVNMSNDNDDAMETENILKYIIYNLPFHLRACLLHLQIFPVGCLIKKETLIWKWVAEGFIIAETETGTGLFELGEAYFKELVNRNLVMPVEDDSHCGLVIGCRVHHLILDRICALSNELNFVMVQSDIMQKPSLGLRVRRLAVKKWDAERGDPLTNCLPDRLRSFSITGCHFGTKLSSLSRFKVLRVVSIEECTLFEGRNRGSNLKHLGKLHLLRYLGLYKTPIDELPEEIGDLISLQTLDLRGTTVKAFPRRVAQIRQLKCLRADEGTAVPDWMGNLTSLEHLWLGEVGKTVNFVGELGKLIELRELQIWIEKLDQNKGKSLVQSMNNLKKMQVLRLMGVSSSVNNANWEGYESTGQLRELHITNSFSSLPGWINASHVPMLSCLHVNVKAVREQDLEIIGSLPELVSLKLLMPSNVVPAIKGNGAFPRLRYFGTSTPVRFQLEAMPCLESFRLQIHMKDLRVADFDFRTLENLPLLQKVELEISSGGDLYVEAVHGLLKHVADKHPNNPNIYVIKTDQIEIKC